MEIFYGTNEFALFVMTLIIFFVAIEVGFRFGHRQKTDADDFFKNHVGALQGALLGLLALLLGFTFAMAVSRFDTRKELVLEESNTIGTIYLRSRLLPDPYSSELQLLLRTYVDTRLAFYDAGVDRNRLNTANAITKRLQERLWLVAIAASQQDPHSVPAGLFVQALNEVIDLHEKRLRALENHVPEVVLYLVCAVAVGALGFIGYGCGLRGRRYFLSTALVAFLVALVLAVILDLDRPRRGLIRVSQDSMEKLKESLESTQ
jgi:hypothetical protein